MKFAHFYSTKWGASFVGFSRSTFAQFLKFGMTHVNSTVALLYRGGYPPVHIRWVVVRHLEEPLGPHALLCTDIEADPLQIVRWYMLRWQIEAIFEEMRVHLGMETRRQDPRRNSEAIVYNQLAESSYPGQVLYGLKAAPEAPELDFCIWFEDRARFALRVKGGLYSVDGTVWTFRTARGVENVTCPLTRTWDAAIAVRDAVYRIIGFKTFIIPVLLFADTPPDPAIEEWSRRRRVKALFGAGDLVNRLLELAERTGLKHPPTADHIMNEVDAVNIYVTPALLRRPVECGRREQS